MELREHAPPSRPVNPGMPYREDCWSEGETSALVDAWGERYLELNRGNLRQKQWQEVADAVNSRIGTTRRKMRTDVQCKNRIDTLKKKYKLEKARLVEGTALTSSWPFYSRLDALIGATTPAAASASGSIKRPSPSPSPPLAIPLPFPKKGLGQLPTASRLHGKLPLLPTALPVDDSFIRKAAAAAAAAASSLPMAHAFIRKTPPVAPPVLSAENSFIRKPPTPPTALPMDNSFIRKAAAAAAAAKGEAAEEEESEVEGISGPRSVSMGESKKGKKRGNGDGVLELAKAIEKMGEMYERVEGARQRQMMEMEKQRMEFLKGLELQRMEMFADLKVQMEKLKRARRSSDAGELIGSVAAVSFLSNSSFL
ncbi:sequence-specific DNA binding transcription factor [Rhynchospora pubera]|uniref:Sequence-specific DNA binding transcription factor n=1 Tax=Rhynchospora pubera TaxID=906938 RepID=A0AAV8HXX7_9POAL|nr:sequence-specific DNA binding transcription factor [Rhynchospora pubera]